MQPLSRRRAIQLAGLGLASVVAGAAGLTWKSSSGFRVTPSAELVEPPVLTSIDGLLQMRLEAAAGPVRIAGRRATALSYNGGLPGPTLHLQPGDRLSVQLVNRLNNPTNLHVHGLHVSPEGNGDNAFVTVKPGASFDYCPRITRPACTGITRTITARSLTRFSADCTAPSSSATQSEDLARCRSPANGSW